MMIAAAAPDSFNWMGPMASLVVGFLLGIFVEPLRHWMFRPVLSLRFTTDEHCVRHTPVKVKTDESVSRSQGHYIRFLVQNTRRRYATSCRAFLARVEQRDSTGQYTTVFADMVPLKWAYLSCAAVDIPGRMGLYCDLVGSSEADPRLLPGCCEPRPQLFDDLFREKAVYRFTAAVTAQHACPVSIRICVNWEGKWNVNDVWTEV